MKYKFELTTLPPAGYGSYNLGITKRTTVRDVVKFVDGECKYNNYKVTMPAGFLEPNQVLIERRRSKLVKFEAKTLKKIIRRRCLSVRVLTNYADTEFVITLKERFIDRFRRLLQGGKDET